MASNNLQTTNERIEQLRDDLIKRAQGFDQLKGLFSGQLIAEELRHWAGPCGR